MTKSAHGIEGRKGLNTSPIPANPPPPRSYKDALGIESDDLANYCFPEDLAGRSRAARPHHRRMAAD